MASLIASYSSPVSRYCFVMFPPPLLNYTNAQFLKVTRQGIASIDTSFELVSQIFYSIEIRRHGWLFHVWDINLLEAYVNAITTQKSYFIIHEDGVRALTVPLNGDKCFNNISQISLVCGGSIKNGKIRFPVVCCDTPKCYAATFGSMGKWPLADCSCYLLMSEIKSRDQTLCSSDRNLSSSCPNANKRLVTLLFNCFTTAHRND